jgi:bacterioferritin-associated ferredoxin
MPPLKITTCVCRHMLFAHLLPMAREQAWDLAALVFETGCGDQCGLCRPYLQQMLETGQTEFHEILIDGS